MEMDTEMYSSWCKKFGKHSRVHAQFFPRRYTEDGIRSPFYSPAFDVKLFPGGLIVSENLETQHHRMYEISNPIQIGKILLQILDTTVDRWPDSVHPRLLPDFYQVKIFPWANVPDEEVSWMCVDTAICRLQEYWVPDPNRLSNEEKHECVQKIANEYRLLGGCSSENKLRDRQVSAFILVANMSYLTGKTGVELEEILETAGDLRIRTMTYKYRKG